ncbi:MAG TPA: hypothetical protein VME70_08975 [Mycobacteriales bacterium]|nr:hypothetical protein [Mycobacteriales bacterium]
MDNQRHECPRVGQDHREVAAIAAVPITGEWVSEGSRRANRLASPRWLDLRFVLGVLLVLVAVVAGAHVFAAAGHYAEVYRARQPLVPGERLAAGDLETGRVRFAGRGAGYVSAAGPAPTGDVVTRYVGAGELVPVAALASAAAVQPARREVTVPVTPGHLPDGLAHGDLVDVYVTATVPSGARVPAPSEVLAAVPVDSDDGGSQSSAGTTVSVVLDAPVDAVSALIHAVEAGTIDLVRLPPSAAAGESNAVPGSGRTTTSASPGSVPP